MLILGIYKDNYDTATQQQTISRPLAYRTGQHPRLTLTSLLVITIEEAVKHKICPRRFVANFYYP